MSIYINKFGLGPPLGDLLKRKVLEIINKFELVNKICSEHTAEA